MDVPLLQLTNVTKSFGAVRALKGVSFDLKPGEVHALLGENGAGKSTLIKVITGAHQPDGGKIEIAGAETRHLTPDTARRLGIACVYQQPALFGDLTVAENIALRLEAKPFLGRINWMDQFKKAADLLAQAGAQIDPKTEVRDLSMPEQQMLEIACALGTGARILIMDEPTASLTRKEQLLLFTLAKDLRRRGVGIIYISHRLEEIFELADRVTVLRDGESVGTCMVEETNEADLIKKMMGREVTLFSHDTNARPAESRVSLSLKNFGCASSGVRNINLDVRSGEIIGLAGMVGAGRTELARAIFGITPADSGVMEIEGAVVNVHNPRQAMLAGLAYVPEDRRRHGVIPEMPVSNNISMAVHRSLFPGGWLRASSERDFAQKWITDLGIKCSGTEAPTLSLSGGNQQKVALARWLATKPKILILDEPTQGVDVGSKNEIHKIIRRLAEEGMAVMMISSDLLEVLGLSDRIAVMRSGTITAIMDGKTADAKSVMSAALGQIPVEGAAS